MTTEYADYTRDRVGWFFGMTGPQLATVTVAGMPLLLAVGVQQWALAGLCLLGWVGALMLVLIPVRGRSATQWFGALVTHAVGRVAGWSAFRGKVSVGESPEPDDADLPGILSAIQVHDGPPRGARMTRVAVIQDHAAQTWAATARVVHPGLGSVEGPARHRMGEGLSQLLEVLARTDLARMLVLQVRTVPDDGAERTQWVAAHRRAEGPALSRRVNDDLAVTLTSASVRTEAFVTVVVAENVLAKPARQSGGGLEGRARALYGLLAEVEAHLLGSVGCASVTWLDTTALAAAVRTGFAPGDRAALVQAATDAADAADGSTITASVPWALAGPPGPPRRSAGTNMTPGGPCPPRYCYPTGARSSARWRRSWPPAAPGSGAATPSSTRWCPTGRRPGPAPARRSPPPPEGRYGGGWASRPGPGSGGTRPRPRPSTPSSPAAGPWSGPPRWPRSPSPRGGRSTTTAASWSPRSAAPATPRNGSTWPPTPGSSPPPSPSVSD